jgi:hypothetical protein
MVIPCSPLQSSSLATKCSVPCVFSDSDRSGRLCGNVVFSSTLGGICDSFDCCAITQLLLLHAKLVLDYEKVMQLRSKYSWNSHSL